MSRSARSANLRRVGCEVQQIYGWIDEQLSGLPAPACLRCGRCCDLKDYGHRLFVTSLEWTYFCQHSCTARIVQLKPGACPFNDKGLCKVYEHRFAGCRIFHCNLDKDLQSALCEAVIGRLKGLCRQYSIDYWYKDLFDLVSFP